MYWWGWGRGKIENNSRDRDVEGGEGPANITYKHVNALI